jgi:phenylacetate-coenzyme A ligase PaaK-like adenylate-forming protein
LFSDSIPLDVVQKLRTDQFVQTIYNATRAPFYNELFAPVLNKIHSIDDLCALPITTREDLERNGPDAQVMDEDLWDEATTRGSSNGEPLIIRRGKREQAAIRAFDVSRFRGRLRRAVRFVDHFHGTRAQVPSSLYCHRLGIYDRGSFARAAKILTGSGHPHELVEDRCTVLIGLERCLRAFAEYCYANCIKSELEFVLSYGDWLSRRWRRRFEDVWECAIIDRYSLAEVLGGATEDPCTGWYEFDPWLIPEVVNPCTLECLRSGTGILVLTAIVPFQVQQPIIRYLTGDAVNVVEKGPRPGDIAIQPLGRAVHGVYTGAGEWLLTPDEIFEAVDSIREIVRAPLFLDSNEVSDNEKIGVPIFDVRTNHSSRSVQIEVSLSHGLTKPDEAQVRSRITDKLMRKIVARRRGDATLVMDLDVCTRAETSNGVGS